MDSKQKVRNALQTLTASIGTRKEVQRRREEVDKRFDKEENEAIEAENKAEQEAIRTLNAFHSGKSIKFNNHMYTVCDDGEGGTFIRSTPVDFVEV